MAASDAMSRSVGETLETGLLYVTAAIVGVAVLLLTKPWRPR